MTEQRKLNPELQLPEFTTPVTNQDNHDVKFVLSFATFSVWKTIRVMWKIPSLTL